MDQLGKLPAVFARKCVAKRISRPEAAAFLDANHRMGYASGRYHYALFETSGEKPVAVATFSSGRRMNDGTRSYEWVRYASLEGTRVVGGMGKLLEAFARDVHPDDVMTYVDASQSDGSSYLEIGFTLESTITRATHTNLKLRKRF